MHQGGGAQSLLSSLESCILLGPPCQLLLVAALQCLPERQKDPGRAQDESYIKNYRTQKPLQLGCFQWPRNLHDGLDV
jgi:hypothetical protein